MKTSIVVLLVVILACTSSPAQSKTEAVLYDQLTGPNAVKALDSVLKKPDEVSALILYMAASAAFTNDRLEDSGFLFYAAKLRTGFDRECFPPQGTGGDSPFVAFSALSQELGSVINPAIMAKPETFNKAVARASKWMPKAPKDYDPGYPFIARKTEAEAMASVKAGRDQYLAGLTDFGTLLSDPEYFAAFRTVQAFNLEAPDKRPTNEDSQKAESTMKRIEKEKNLKGFFSK